VGRVDTYGRAVPVERLGGVLMMLICECKCGFVHFSPIFGKIAMIHMREEVLGRGDMGAVWSGAY
jgi:hypothetical protein